MEHRVPSTVVTPWSRLHSAMRGLSILQLLGGDVDGENIWLLWCAHFHNSCMAPRAGRNLKQCS